MEEVAGNCTHSILLKEILEKVLNRTTATKENYYDDSSNSYKYIIFVLVVYAVSFMGLMVKYFKKSRHENQSRDADFLYNEFIKRETFDREKHMKDKIGEKKLMVDALADQLPLAAISLQMMKRNKRGRNTGSSIANEEIMEEEEDESLIVDKKIYMKSASVT